MHDGIPYFKKDLAFTYMVLPPHLMKVSELGLLQLLDLWPEELMGAGLHVQLHKGLPLGLEEWAVSGVSCSYSHAYYS